MSIAPYKNRTISLQFESSYEAQFGVNKIVSSLISRYLPSQGRSKVSAIPKKFDAPILLKGPSSVTIDHTTGVAEEAGIYTSFIQPWFIQNVKITIKGTSYLGAYPVLSISDRDAEKLAKTLYQSLNDFSGRSGPKGSKERVVLDIGGNPDRARTFIGYIQNLSLSENIESIYMMDYSFTFIGKNMELQALAKGAADAKGAKG